MTNQTHRLEAWVTELLTTGVTAPYKELVDSLERNARAVREIVQNKTAAEKLESVQDLMNDITGLMSFLNGKLNTTNENLVLAYGEKNLTETGLDALTGEANKLEQQVQELRQQVHNIKNANIHGAMSTISAAHLESQNAELRSKAATSDPGNTVEQSAALRKTTEDKLSSSQKEFDRKNQRNTQKLDKLSKELDKFDLSPLSVKMCGGSAEGESCSSCGGFGCGRKDGAPHCGGEGCSGFVTTSETALKSSQNLDQEIQQAMEEVDKLSRIVWEANIRANEAKAKAAEVLSSSNRSRERVEQSNSQLRDLIKEIRDLLTNERANASVIEAVANEVLALEMPTSAEKLKELTNEIREKVGMLTSVEEILSQSAEDIRSAESLLNQAKSASENASNLKERADTVKAALDETERAQSLAQDAMQLAKSNIKETQDLLDIVESETERSEQVVSETTGRLLELERELGLLRQNNLEMNQKAETAERVSERAKLIAEEAQKEFDEDLKDKLEAVEEHVEVKGESTLKARRRADELLREARELFAQSNSKLQRLKELENSYEVNQRLLEEKAEALAELEQTARLILEDISNKVSLYGSCQ